MRLTTLSIVNWFWDETWYHKNNLLSERKLNDLDQIDVSNILREFKLLLLEGIQNKVNNVNMTLVVEIQEIFLYCSCLKS